MDRITRKELKTDKFALEVSHTMDFFEEHRKEILRYGAVALVVALAVTAIYFYRRQQRNEQTTELAQAIRVYQAPVGQAAPNASLSFPTQEAKAAEAKKSLTSVAAKYGGSDEGQVAHYYLGALAVDQGNLAEAEKHFKQASDSGDEKYASLARLALGELYFAQGRADQGEKILRALMQNSTIFVSKEQAAIALAKNLMRTKPEEARKLVEPLRTQRGEASKVAIQLYSEIPAR